MRRWEGFIPHLRRRREEEVEMSVGSGSGIVGSTGVISDGLGGVRCAGSGCGGGSGGGW